jgi:hypothetical protein
MLEPTLSEMSSTGIGSSSDSMILSAARAAASASRTCGNRIPNSSPPRCATVSLPGSRFDKRALVRFKTRAPL